MRVRRFRRQFTRFWNSLSWLAAPIVLLEILLLMVIARNVDAATPVALQPVEQLASFETVRSYAGRTAAGRASELGFKQPGQLTRVLVDRGDRVTEGQVLAHQDSASLEALLQQALADVALAEAEVLAAGARADLAEQRLARFVRLRQTGHVSEQDHDEHLLATRARQAERKVAEAALARARAGLSAAEIAVRDATLRAPFAGTIQERRLDEGTQVRPGEPVLRLVESGRARALVGVPEAQAPHLQPGASYPLAWNGTTVAATLTALLPEVDAQTRTLVAVLEFNDDAVPLGAVVELQLTQAVAVSGFWLPLTALAESDRGLWGVYVVDASSRLERRLVEVLHTEADRAFVRGTLRDGEQIVASGVQRLVPGQPVEPAEQG